MERLSCENSSRRSTQRGRDAALVAHLVARTAASPRTEARWRARGPRPDVQQLSAVCHARFQRIDPNRLVFLDECGASTNITRLGGRCPAGQRLVSSTPPWTYKLRPFLAKSLPCGLAPSSYDLDTLEVHRGVAGGGESLPYGRGLCLGLLRSDTAVAVSAFVNAGWPRGASAGRILPS
jgi:hypothetical protein